MRAHEMTEFLGSAASVAASLTAVVLTRRRINAPKAGEQTGGSRFGAMRLSRLERARRGLTLPSEGSGRSPPCI